MDLFFISDIFCHYAIDGIADAKSYSAIIFLISSFTVNILSTRYAFAPAKANPSFKLPFLEFDNARAMQYGAFL